MKNLFVMRCENHIMWFSLCCMKLHTFIELIGDQAAAKLFEVPERTANSWRLKERKPKTQTALHIVEKTKDHPKGHVTLEDIYAD